eukprot:2943203-Pyramimonas_sp.AAC.1
MKRVRQGQHGPSDETPRRALARAPALAGEYSKSVRLQEVLLPATQMPPTSLSTGPSQGASSSSLSWQPRTCV